MGQDRDPYKSCTLIATDRVRRHITHDALCGQVPNGGYTEDITRRRELGFVCVNIERTRNGVLTTPRHISPTPGWKARSGPSHLQHVQVTVTFTSKGIVGVLPVTGHTDTVGHPRRY